MARMEISDETAKALYPLLIGNPDPVLQALLERLRSRVAVMAFEEKEHESLQQLMDKAVAKPRSVDRGNFDDLQAIATRPTTP